MSDKQQSAYKAKTDRGNQLYGPGCCAHRITKERVQAHKDSLREKGWNFQKQRFETTANTAVRRSLLRAA